MYADVTVYEARGELQLVVRQLEPRGEGALQLAFEQLRRRLEAEGLFDPSRKRALPTYIRRTTIKCRALSQNTRNSASLLITHERSCHRNNPSAAQARIFWIEPICGTIELQSQLEECAPGLGYIAQSFLDQIFARIQWIQRPGLHDSQ